MTHNGKILRCSDIILENSGKISGLRSLYFTNKFGNNYWSEEGVLSASKFMTNCITLENGIIDAHNLNTKNIDTFALNTTQFNILDEHDKPKCGFFDGILKTAAIDFVDEEGNSMGKIKEDDGITITNLSLIEPKGNLEISGNLIVYGREILVENVKNIVNEPMLTLGGTSTYNSYIKDKGIGINHYDKGKMGFFGIYKDEFTYLTDISGEDLSTGKTGNAKFDSVITNRILTKSIESQNLEIKSNTSIKITTPIITFNSKVVINSNVTIDNTEVKNKLVCDTSQFKNVCCDDFSCNSISINDNDKSNVLQIKNGELMLNGESVHCKNKDRHNDFNGGVVENPTTFLSDVKINNLFIDDNIFCKKGFNIQTKENTHTLVVNEKGFIGINNKNPKYVLDIKKQGNEITLKTDGAIWAKGGIYTNSFKNMTNLSKVSENFALEYINNIHCFGDGISNIRFDAEEVKKILPEAIHTVKDYVPNEDRNINDYKWRKSKKQWKLTIKDLSNSESHVKYKFLVKDEIGDEPSIVIRPTLKKYPQSFKFNKKWNHIFLYGREVEKLNLINKEKIYTLHHPAIQELYRKTQILESKLKKEENKTQHFKLQVLLLFETFKNLNIKISKFENVQ